MSTYMNQNQLENKGKVDGSNALPEPYWNAGRRVFAVWAAIVLVGFLGTQMYQENPTSVNLGWGILSLFGLGYMKKLMPFSEPALKKIYGVWFAIVVLGIAFSQAAFYSPTYGWLTQYLGAIWLGLMALGHGLTGLIDKKGVYGVTVGMQVAALAAILFLPSVLAIQYVVAGLVGALAMIWLILYA